jgi:hypothetical protein
MTSQFPISHVPNRSNNLSTYRLESIITKNARLEIGAHQLILWRVEEENEFVAIDLAHTRGKTGNFHAMQRLIHLKIIGEGQPLPEHRTSYTI